MNARKYFTIGEMATTPHYIVEYTRGEALTLCDQRLTGLLIPIKKLAWACKTCRERELLLPISKKVL
jgi:hypothetical protein